MTIESSRPGTRDAAPFLALVSTRRSVRSFAPAAVPAATVERILAAACFAPSAHHAQPWRFAIIRSAKARALLAGRLAQSLGAWLTAEGASPPEIRQQVARTKRRLEDAPVAILLCLCTSSMPPRSDPAQQAAERILAIQGVAASGALLLLAAHAEGLGACWYGTPVFAPGVFQTCLELPGDWEPQALFLCGVPAGRREAERSRLESTAFVCER